VEARVQCGLLSKLRFKGEVGQELLVSGWYLVERPGLRQARGNSSNGGDPRLLQPQSLVRKNGESWKGRLEGEAGRGGCHVNQDGYASGCLWSHSKQWEGTSNP
jgi:hypothetical protein